MSSAVDTSPKVLVPTLPESSTVSSTTSSKPWYLSGKAESVVAETILQHHVRKKIEQHGQTFRQSTQRLGDDWGNDHLEILFIHHTVGVLVDVLSTSTQ